MSVLKVKNNGVWENVGYPSISDANTLGGKTADEFALTSDIEELQSQIGDQSVADQISEAFVNSVPVERIIAGLDLVDDITAEELRVALNTYPIIIYNNPPMISTKGHTGQLYFDTIRNNLYTCIGNVTESNYTWFKITLEKGIDYWTDADKKEIETYIDSSVSDLEAVLQDILKAIQAGNSASMTIAEIEQLIVSYFETRTAEEVEA